MTLEKKRKIQAKWIIFYSHDRNVTDLSSSRQTSNVDRYSQPVITRQRDFHLPIKTYHSFSPITEVSFFRTMAKEQRMRTREERVPLALLVVNPCLVQHYHLTKEKNNISALLVSMRSDYLFHFFNQEILPHLKKQSQLNAPQTGADYHV